MRAIACPGTYSWCLIKKVYTWFVFEPTVAKVILKLARSGDSFNFSNTSWVSIPSIFIHIFDLRIKKPGISKFEKSSNYCKKGFVFSVGGKVGV